MSCGTHRTPRDGLNKSVDCSSTHRKLSRADGLFRVSLGVCPLCGSPRIRIRRRRHRNLLWHCRRCNRVFRTPSIAEYVLPPGDPGRGYVFARSIPQMERWARLRRRHGTRHISGLVKLVATATFVLLMGAVGWYLVFADGLGRGGGANRPPLGAGTHTPIPVSPTVLPTEIPGRDDLYRSLLPQTSQSTWRTYGGTGRRSPSSGS